MLLHRLRCCGARAGYVWGEAEGISLKSGAILVGDVGGTNVRFAVARPIDKAAGGGLALSEIWKRPGRNYPDFEAAMAAYLAESGETPIGASFGLAGPVQAGRVHLLHAGWTVAADSVRSRLGVARVVLVNDFVAMARSAPELPAADLREISPGKAAPGEPVAVSGPGTGLGVAVLRPQGDGAGWIVMGGEGGHQAFAPQTDIDWRVAEWLRPRKGFVSNEMIVAGAGFDMTLEALSAVMGVAHETLSPGEVLDRAEKGDALCVEFCRLRARTVMTSIGNTVLSANATGGAYLAGGVGVRLERWFREPGALAQFYQRGWREEMMRPIPIQLIVSETAPLLGAAHLFLDEQKRGWL